jgi:tetratricopeptide (TPR) repeat protein
VLKHTATALAAALAASVLIGALLWSRQGAGERNDLAQARSQHDPSAVGDTLTEDGRIGKVADLQGIVTLRPATASRWSPLAGHVLLRPGDWVRTDLRGANAVTLRLAPQTQVILGPGSLVELVSPKEIRLAQGELRIAAAAKSPVGVTGPDGKRLAVEGKRFFRVKDGRLAAVDKDPLWLQGYEGKAAAESLGSLVAKVDGRDVPLTVGYHKVAVDIRDQIARTTIEESFVNHTDGTLEGVFFFPLPQDASIAGFGMWIGDRLVEADVVERQRAREIYETILREHRDPGLLEWSGGNLFKARVSPILPHAEKRITITYTQVLPLCGGAYRYQYALQSEMLRQHPLRQLEIDVKVASAMPLSGVTCPTHAARTAATAHSAHVEFSAQEYTPAQDFEVVVEVDGRQNEVVLVPHRRGEDGYFLVQLTPPAPEGRWRRELVADGEPLELLLVADTSASMDVASRKLQAEVVAAILSALGPKDRVNLATCDVDCDWAFARPAPADEQNVERLRQFLAARVSLGWTNLDRALASALKQAGPKTQVVYIGDGIVMGYETGIPDRLAAGLARHVGTPPVPVADPADPAAFAKRLRRLTEGKPGTFHAVAVSSSFEPAVMKAIAAVGGGSLRQVTGSRGPQAVALDLLAEITQPALRDLRVEFRGLRVARVYPEQLPNLPLGTQQILLGRYLPDDRREPCEVIVTGTQSGKPVRYAAKVSLPEGSVVGRQLSVVSGQLSVATNNGQRTTDTGNSFIPRLWARMYLDALLEQGASPAVRDEIIALSEEYHIITPYTSLLVLESDADRERFKVKRRFQIRDGEKFFAAGRDTANWELVQQQMQRAGTWRAGLRRNVLRQLAALGRNPQAVNRYLRTTTATDFDSLLDLINSTVAPTSWGTVSGSGSLSRFQTDLSLVVSQTQEVHENIVDLLEQGRADAKLADWSDAVASAKEGVWASKALAETYPEPPDMPVATAGELGDEQGEAAKEEAVNGEDLERAPKKDEIGDQDEDRKDLAGEDPFAETESMALHERKAAEEPLAAPACCEKPRFDRFDVGDVEEAAGAAGSFGGMAGCYAEGVRGYQTMGRSYNRSQAFAWLGSLFSSIPAAEKPRPVESRWPPEARVLARSLVHDDGLRGVKEGVQVEIARESYTAESGALAGRSQTLALVSPSAWLTRSTSDRGATTVAWCDGHQRGVLSKAFLLGCVRKSQSGDLDRLPPELATTPLDEALANYAVQLQPQGGDRTLLLLTPPNDASHEVRVLVDTRRKVVLRTEYFEGGRLSCAVICEDFVEVGGAWRPTRTETTDERGRRTSLTRHKYTLLAAGRWEPLWGAELAVRPKAQLLGRPLPRLAEVKKALAAGKAGFEDQILMLLHFQASQQWDRVLAHLAAAEKLSGKPGMRWVRGAVLNLARHRQEVKDQYFNEAQAMAEGKTQSPPTASGGLTGANALTPNALTPGPSPKGRGEIGGDDLFLAEYLQSQTGGILEANERLALLALLRPVYQRQPTYLQAMQEWEGRRADLLDQTGQTQQALALRRSLAEQYPKDADLQRRYAAALSEAGELDAAYAWLNHALGAGSRWSPDEEQTLRVAYADLMRSEGRYAELADYLAAWVQRNPPVPEPYRQYLSALVWANRVKDADETISRWLEVGKSPPTASAGSAAGSASAGSADEQRLRAAVHQAFGEGYNLNTNRIDEKWQRPLADVALALARHPALGSLADEIMGRWQFQQSDECRRVRKTALRTLRDEIEKLTPEQVQRLVNWISASDPAVELPEWQKIAAGLRRRWEAEPKREVRARLGQTLVGVLGHVGPQETLAFLRRELADASPDERAGYTRQLFDTLLGQPWSAEMEDELFALVDRLSDAQLPADRLAAQITALLRLSDALLRARFDAAMPKVEHPEKLTRTELRARREENLRQARQGLADRLRLAAAKAPEKLVPWITVERLYLDVMAGRGPDRVADECWELLGPKPAAPADPQDPMAAINRLLRHRVLAMLMNLATRTPKPQAPNPRDAVPGLSELSRRVLAYLGEAASGEPENPQWKLLQYQLLIALDRPKELRQKLQRWIDAGEPANYWRLALGYLLAEEGRLREAATLFEAVRQADELRAGDYRALAGWYQVLDRREEHNRAITDALKTAPEYQLSNWIARKLNPWQRDWSATKQPPPRELDREVPLAFVALLEKASQPQNYHYQLDQFYHATRDFRLLGALADGLIGHTPGQVYPLLQGMGPLLAEIRDEATLDTLVERLGEVRKRSRTAIDRRALDLLELLAERRAAELQNQPGPHAQRALAALQRAWKHEWSPGEPRLMADLLASLGAISQKDLAAEQVRLLECLERDEGEGGGKGAESGESEKSEKGVKSGTDGDTPVPRPLSPVPCPLSPIDRLHIRHALARTYWSYDRREQAIDRLTAALAEYQATVGGRLPAAANDALGTLVSYMESLRQYVRAENYLREQLRHPANGQQRFWLVERLYQVEHEALTHDGEVSLGRGAALYRAIEAAIQKDLDAPDQNHRNRLVVRLCGVYRAAAEKRLPGVVADLKKFAFERLPQVLARQTNGYDEMVSTTAQTLHDLAGPREGLALLVWHAEHEPVWFQFNYGDVWSRHEYTIGQWRSEARGLGDLEGRLLGVVLAELRRDLRSRQSRNRCMYDCRWGWYWAEKEADFARAAEESLTGSKDSGAAVSYVAEYLFRGVHRPARAIELLLDAQRREVLDESGQSQLVRFLHEQNRFAESIAILEPLVSRRPENLAYSVWLMHAYHRTAQPKRLADLLRQTDELFHKNSRWQESVMAGLGESCLENTLFEPSAAYFREAIAHHQQSAPHRGIGDGTLSHYYGQMAAAYSGLKRTAEAVDAACGAVVSWGHDTRNRGQALAALRTVLQQAADLDAYLALLDRQTHESGLENPIVRKAAGQVYRERKQYGKAIAQLRLALQAQPGDAETHQALLACYDAQGDREGAAAALLGWRELDRRNLGLYRDLGHRLEKLGRPDQTERAFTSIVEILPAEAESHQMLAEIRQEENRWPEAVFEWQQAARIRSLEPTGLLGLAAAQIHDRRLEDAQATLDRLRSTGWPARFDSLINQKLPELQRALDAARLGGTP